MNIEKIKKNIIVNPNGCWEWQKSCNSAGYGQITENGVYWTTHRYAYVCEYGDLKPDDVVRHMCHNTRCCNPAHLKKKVHSKITGKILRPFTEMRINHDVKAGK